MKNGRRKLRMEKRRRKLTLCTSLSKMPRNITDNECTWS
jgi:hypothetical protein